LKIKATDPPEKAEGLIIFTKNHLNQQNIVSYRQKACSYLPLFTTKKRVAIIKKKREKTR